MALRPAWRFLGWGAVSVLLVACAGAPERRSPGRYGFDSASNACRQRPDLCARIAGEESVVPLSRAARFVASAAGTGGVALRVLDAVTRERIQKALEECADQARSEVLLKVMGGRSPTPRECNEQVGVDAQGRPVTLAMQLGNEMHAVALGCARERLGALWPKRFSLEQRYKYDQQAGTVTLMSREEVQRLLREGRGSELLGTLVPDVVVHTGDPLQAQTIFDFKFPCVSSNAPPWRPYPEGHPYESKLQNEVYEKALGAETWRIVPRWGAIR